MKKIEQLAPQQKKTEIFNSFIDDCNNAHLSIDDIHEIIGNFLVHYYKKSYMITIIGEKPNRKINRFNHGFEAMELIGAIEHTKLSIVIDNSTPEELRRFISKPKDE